MSTSTGLRQVLMSHVVLQWWGSSASWHLALRLRPGCEQRPQELSGRYCRSEIVRFLCGIALQFS